MYTGGLENYPQLVAELAAQRPLLGVANPAPLRELETIDCLAQASGLPPLAHLNERPATGRWLLKSRSSSGGLHIRVSDAAAAISAASDGAYWQPWIEGLSLGATFVFGRHDWRLLGLCEQLSGTPWTGAPGLAYAGSIGPLTTAAAEEQMLAFGEQLFASGLARGLIGVDAILDDEQRLHILEINPRYTASVEIHERAIGGSALALHVAACRGERVALTEWPAATACHGKAILYATNETTISLGFVERCLAANAGRAWPLFADIPHPGSRSERGAPVVTVFASGGCSEEVRFLLRQQAARLAHSFSS
jgi:predicted ATP-grasp superfamily ATP-dependent carboligase